jgi:hypothetical protein
VTVIFPEEAGEGTLVWMVVGLTELTTAGLVLNLTLLLPATGWKLIPVIVTAVPGVPIEGVNPVIVGALPAATTKEAPLVADPFGVVTLIGPVVAPAGTVATIEVVVAEATVALTPLNRTVFWLAISLKPLP